VTVRYSVVWGTAVVVLAKWIVVLVVLLRLIVVPQVLLVVLPGTVVDNPAGPVVGVGTVPPSVVLLEAFWSSSPNPKRQEGSSTGVRNTMITTTAIRQPAAAPSSLRLCSRVPRRIVRKKPLSKKKRAMLTEFFTSPGYQKRRSADTGRWRDMNNVIRGRMDSEEKERNRRPALDFYENVMF